jgi:predicted O-methyltransferase YrrM
MQIHLVVKDVALLTVLALALAVLAFVIVPAESLGLALLVVLCSLLVATFVFELYRRLFAQHQELLAEMAQGQTFVSLVNLLAPRAALPALRNWAVSPDLGLLLVSEVQRLRPQVIVECGSGSSTVLMAYMLQRLGSGRIVSLEHDQPSKEKTDAALRQHGLEAFATVVLAPLKATTLGAETFQFYDLSRLSDLKQVDMLFVDGPPSFMQALARYPALPLLWDRLSPGAVVVLDDARRAKERRIGARWRAEFPQATHELVETQKGALVVRKS